MTPSADQVAAFQANGGFAPSAVSAVVLAFVFAVLLLWGVWAMPVWVALVSLVLSAAAVFLVFWQFKSHAATLRAEAVPAQRVDRRQVATAGEPEKALREMMGTWLGSAQTAGANLQQARTLLDEVTQQTEAAATSIGKSFQQVMSKTGQQMDDAVRLLKSNSDGAGGSTWLSLPGAVRRTSPA